MIFRRYVEKKPGLRNEEDRILSDAQTLYGIEGLEEVRLLKRYDVDMTSEDLFDLALEEVFSDPPVDLTYQSLEEAQDGREADFILAVEALPGQFDQRADSAEQCIQMLLGGDRPRVLSAQVYLFYGTLTEADQAKLRRLLINPVDSREAGLDKKGSLAMKITPPDPVRIIEGFRNMDSAALDAFREDRAMAMGLDDLTLIQDYFKKKDRDPSEAELGILDTYWSDHCRHTTFNTVLDQVTFEDPLLETSYQDYLKTREELGRTKPITFMDLGTIAGKALRAQGKLEGLDTSEEINACTVKIRVTIDGKEEPWLLLFKNETHNHPTEIEPFGGAATCIGGAIRDPLSGRAYCYGAMRVTGAGDPLTPVEETLEGKLPQIQICREAAQGYSSYGNQIGLATGQVREIYHPNYVAKRLEVGAVVAAVPANLVRRETPQPGDPIILLGGRTGRDGIGGATGSSKAQKVDSAETAGAEVQKGNAPEERKLQRFFRNPKAVKMIKRCNDFGAGGVSVAIGELADGLEIDLDKVPKKYEGLNGLELAISESQERMAVCIDPEDLEEFLAMAHEENLEATQVAVVTEEPRVKMTWQGKTIVDLDRSFLDENGADKHITVETAKYTPSFAGLVEDPKDFASAMEDVVSNLNGASQRGLAESFDATIGKGTVLMPFGGQNQLTPPEAMVQKISVEKADTEDVSFMAWGFDPYLTASSPYHGAYYAVVDSLTKLVAAGADLEETYLSFQEYFLRLDQDPKRWGLPMAALLGAYQAQMDFGLAAIGGKDSMSGSFEDLDVPPTLISFAVTTGKLDRVLSPEFKGPGHKVYLLSPKMDDNQLLETDSLRALFAYVDEANRAGKILAAGTPDMGGIAHKVFEMALGNGMGFIYEDRDLADLFDRTYGSLILEVREDLAPSEAFELTLLGRTTDDRTLQYKDEVLDLADLLVAYEDTLEEVYPLEGPEIREADLPALKAKASGNNPMSQARAKLSRVRLNSSQARPKVLIPVCPGTNTEYDAAQYIREGGLDPQVFVVRNQTSRDIAESTEAFRKALDRAQVLYLPGGFSGGDEPDGSAKFMASFLRNEGIAQAIEDLLYQREGLALGICNGFQALVKLGLLPYGHITDPKETAPTLTYNRIGRHQSRIVNLRVASTDSPWLSFLDPDRLYKAPISHGEGRFLARDEDVQTFFLNGQVAFQYADPDGRPSMDIAFNPNGSTAAIEGLMAADGRILGKMGHTERSGAGLYLNVPGTYDMKFFQAAKAYFDREI